MHPDDKSMRIGMMMRQGSRITIRKTRQFQAYSHSIVAGGF